jgi:exonuclease SbcD
MSRGYRLLCTGDLHVGRRPSRVDGWIDPARCSCAAIFKQLVECAIDQRVDAVAISGDLVDQSNKYHEALGPLERGLRQLAEAGIDVVAIAGNHDFDVLPRLADAMADAADNTPGAGRFHLLGRGGTWQCAVLGNGHDGRPPLRVIGYSFPTERVRVNPMQLLQTATLDGFACNGDGPVLGLLHADLDQPASDYAPVMRRDLCSATGTCASLWLLGHIHKPSWMPGAGGAPALLYPGSPAAMDPGEAGPHGPWLVQIDPRGQVSARQIPLAAVRYDLVEIDLSGVSTVEAFDAILQKQLRAHVQRACDACSDAGPGAQPPELCCARVRLVGATSLHRQLRELAAAAVQQVDIPVGRCRVRLDAISIDTRPLADLQQLATGRSVAAELARVLLALDGPESAAMSGLSGEAANLASEISLARAYQPLCGDADFAAAPPDAACLRASLRRQGMLLLDELLQQRQAQDAPAEAHSP